MIHYCSRFHKARVWIFFSATASLDFAIFHLSFIYIQDGRRSDAFQLIRKAFLNTKSHMAQEWLHVLALIGQTFRLLIHISCVFIISYLFHDKIIWNKIKLSAKTFLSVCGIVVLCRPILLLSDFISMKACNMVIEVRVISFIQHGHCQVMTTLSSPHCNLVTTIKFLPGLPYWDLLSKSSKNFPSYLCCWRYLYHGVTFTKVNIFRMS